MSKKYWLREDEMDFLNYGPRPGWEHVSEEEVEKRIKKYAGEYPSQYAEFMDKLRAEGRAWLGMKGWERYQAQVERPESAWRGNPIRQHKSPYFYVRKGSGFVLLDNHEETSTRYKTEAEAKKAVLALNDAWRAKHGTRAKHTTKSNPRRSLTPVSRGEVRRIYKPKPITEARIEKAVERASHDFWFSLQNAYPDAPYLDESDDAVRAADEHMLDAVRAWVREHGFRVKGVPTRRNGSDAKLRHAVERASVAFWVSIEESLPEVTEKMNRTPFGHATNVEVDAFNDGMLAIVKEWLAETPSVRGNPRRRNPAPTRAEIVERADISIENGMGSETMTALEDMLDGYDGDNIRAHFYFGWRDSDLQALLDELGTRNVRRRNPRRRSRR
jgi:hypothetical protein